MVTTDKFLHMLELIWTKTLPRWSIFHPFSVVRMTSDPWVCFCSFKFQHTHSWHGWLSWCLHIIFLFRCTKCFMPWKTPWFSLPTLEGCKIDGFFYCSIYGEGNTYFFPSLLITSNAYTVLWFIFSVRWTEILKLSVDILSCKGENVTSCIEKILPSGRNDGVKFGPGHPGTMDDLENVVSSFNIPGVSIAMPQSSGDPEFSKSICKSDSALPAKTKKLSMDRSDSRKYVHKTFCFLYLIFENINCCCKWRLNYFWVLYIFISVFCLVAVFIISSFYVWWGL